MNKKLNERDELIKSISNRCAMYWMLQAGCGEYGDLFEDILPTILEDLYVDAQTLVHEFCIKEQ